VEICLTDCNIPQARRLLSNAEDLLQQVRRKDKVRGKRTIKIKKLKN